MERTVFPLKKARWIALALALFSLLTLAGCGGSQPPVATDAPSEMFISLYSKVFDGDPDYQVYDRDDNCITEEFRADFLAYYEKGDFVPIWDAVAEHGYSLRFPEFEDVEKYMTAAPQ